MKFLSILTRHPVYVVDCFNTEWARCVYVVELLTQNCNCVNIEIKISLIIKSCNYYEYYTYPVKQEIACAVCYKTRQRGNWVLSILCYALINEKTGLMKAILTYVACYETTLF